MNPRLLSIRYWPTWIGLGLLRCLCRLPYPWQIAVGRRLGRLSLQLARRRRGIAETNLSLCFPEWTVAERRRLLEEHFVSLGIGILEMAMSWWGTERQLRKLFTLEGLDNLREALDKGKGVILLSAHFTTLEIGGRLLSLQAPFHVLYREHKNAAFESVMQAARTRNFDKAIPRGDLRGMLKSLGQNMPVWYAPDQDHGADHSLFVPFFGAPAATLTAVSRLARLSGAAIVPFFQVRLPGDRGYRLTLSPALADFPGESIEQDLHRVNALIEERVRERPEQYLWVHRRFKTRPPGMPDVYKIIHRRDAEDAKKAK
ncbi:MAG: LpxL/LpxP family Kdo(2)-lipid IV(A) lauroyl/palmitoleoyl acyltransferase [Gammaproteobacteria bacterium]|jgi:KDO2-lipid IV(A) lauroyltransferase